MKKIFFSLVALAAIAACSKSEVEYDQTGAITLAPVASNATKSVAGYNNDTFDGVFPTDIALYVFANVQDVEEGNTWNSPYFKNALFTHTSAKGDEATQTHPSLGSVSTTGAYAGNPNPYYWPNVKTLKFTGVSKACNINETTNGAVPVIKTGNEATMTITIENYVQDNTRTAEGANDLMWFPIAGPFGKGEKEIPAQMKHACSWITINVFGDTVTAGKWTLKSLLIKGINHTGNVVCGTTATWDTLSNASDEYYYNSGTSTITDSAAEYAATANNFIVIPQTPTSLDVTYTYTSDATNSLTCTETKNISLKYTAEDSENTAWQSGVHYIYNVKITATEILIDPVVVDWTPGATTNTTI